MRLDCSDLALAVVVVHLGFLLWVVVGALVTRGRRWAAALHIGCLAYGIVIELSPWPCPLTALEQHFEACAGLAPYQGSFLLHYLQLLVYPNLSNTVLIAGAVAVCCANLWIYAERWRRDQKRRRRL